MDPFYCLIVGGIFFLFVPTDISFNKYLVEYMQPKDGTFSIQKLHICLFLADINIQDYYIFKIARVSYKKQTTYFIGILRLWNPICATL